MTVLTPPPIPWGRTAGGAWCHSIELQIEAKSLHQIKVKKSSQTISLHPKAGPTSVLSWPINSKACVFIRRFAKVLMRLYTTY
jgi:hypothetical protein